MRGKEDLQEGTKKKNTDLGEKILSVNLKLKYIGAVGGTIWSMGTWNPGSFDCITGKSNLVFTSV